MNLTINSNIEGTITSLAFGGAGVLRFEGRVIFVPFTAPGDEVIVRIKEVKSNFALADLVKVISPSKDRLESAQCPYFGTCGGCQLQHLTQGAQLQYKQNAILDALKRIGGIGEIRSFKMIGAEKNWEYRKHIQMHLRVHEDRFQFGYIAIDNQTLLPVEQCPIFLKPAHSLFSILKTLINSLDNPLRQKGRVTIIKTEKDQFILSFQFEKEIPKNAKNISLDPMIQGIEFKSKDQTLIFGNTSEMLSCGPLTLRITPGVFLQNHPEQSFKLYQKVCEFFEGDPFILDLYCGIGITSLLLAKLGSSVHGVESNPKAIAIAKENALSNCVDRVTFQTARVEEVQELIVRPKETQSILVNPPRAGLDPKVVQALLRSEAKKIVYISCMPSTLARDLKTLLTKYQIEDCLGFDLFPQTAHVETIVKLRLRIKN